MTYNVLMGTLNPTHSRLTRLSWNKRLWVLQRTKHFKLSQREIITDNKHILEVGNTWDYIILYLNCSKAVNFVQTTQWD